MSESSALQTPVWQPVDWNLSASAPADCDPFQADLFVLARGPDGREMQIPGFYRGENQWCVRFAPATEGEWSLISLSSLPGLAGRTCVVRAMPNQGPWRPGPVYASADSGHLFRHADGSPHFLFGYECNWLWALDQTVDDIPRTRRLLDNLAEARFNHVMVNSFAYDCRWAEGKTRPNDFGPPEMIPWKGSHDAPEYATLNTAYFDHYDRMMWALYERGMTAHIYLKVYNKLVNWPKRRSPEERLFFDYFVARYQAFPNVVWNFSKECYNEPDKDYVAECLRHVRQLDAYSHPTTVHDDWYFTYNQPYRRCVDFVTDQNHREFYHTCLDQRNRRLGPVVNAEFGYEHGPGGMEDNTYGVVQPGQEVLHRACEVIMAGAFPVYYYTNHAWDIIEWDEKPAGLEWWRRLHDVVTAAPWHTLEPRPDLGFGGVRVRTDGDRHMLLYSAHGRGGIVIAREWAGSTWRGESTQLISGERRPIELSHLQPGRRQHLGDALGEGLLMTRLRRES